MINDSQSSFDTVDASGDDLQLFVDGTVSPLKSLGPNSPGKILHKPSRNKWERRLVKLLFFGKFLIAFNLVEAVYILV